MIQFIKSVCVSVCVCVCVCVCARLSAHACVCVCVCVCSAPVPLAGLSSPPANITTSVPSLVTPMVNGFTGIPHQPNGHPAVEAVYTNGLPSYSTQSPSAADTLQQAFTGVQQYTGTPVVVGVVRYRWQYRECTPILPKMRYRVSLSTQVYGQCYAAFVNGCRRKVGMGSAPSPTYVRSSYQVVKTWMQDA